MKRNYSISVAMATFNGEDFIEEQLNSILEQLEGEDEVVVSDDGSSDKTLAIVRKFEDKRIKIIDGPKKGVKQNFANAISHCKGKYIFLADQDDIWDKDKVGSMLEAFSESIYTCVVHDAEIFDSKSGKIIEKSFFRWRKSGPGIVKNIWRNTYIGCCMAFDAKMKQYILPIPDNIEMHDQWIGIMCEKHGKGLFLDKELIQYRRHNNNVSELRHNSLWRMLTNRFFILKDILCEK